MEPGLPCEMGAGAPVFRTTKAKLAGEPQRTGPQNERGNLRHGGLFAHGRLLGCGGLFTHGAQSPHHRPSAPGPASSEAAYFTATPAAISVESASEKPIVLPDALAARERLSVAVGHPLAMEVEFGVAERVAVPEPLLLTV